jgi:tetratricopeptide (TPR) repeat protein
MMRSDLWGWFNRYAAEAFLEGHPLKQKMPHLYDLGWEALRAEKPEEALGHFEEGLRIAYLLNDPCWDLYFDYWATETHIFYQNNYKIGLDRAVKVAARAHQERYQACPIRARVYYSLMYVYYAMDAIGYEDKIREMVDFMEREIPLDDDTYQRIQYTRASLAFALDDYDEAENLIQHYLDITLGNPHRQAGGFNMLRQISYARGKIVTAFDYGYQSELFAKVARLQTSVASALLWQAVSAIRLGQKERAALLHQSGKAHHERYQLKPLPGYYNSVCEYLELSGDTEQALNLRELEIKSISEVGSVDYTAEAHLQYARLLGRMGRDVKEALAQAYEAAAALQRPQRYVDKLKKLEAGDFYEYEWQKGFASS